MRTALSAGQDIVLDDGSTWRVKTIDYATGVITCFAAAHELREQVEGITITPSKEDTLEIECDCGAMTVATIKHLTNCEKGQIK